MVVVENVSINIIIIFYVYLMPIIQKSKTITSAQIIFTDFYSFTSKDI